MALYAHTRIYDWRDGKTYEPGDEVPDDLPGLDEIVQYSEDAPDGEKSVSEEPWSEPSPPSPSVVNLDGATYVRADEVNRKVANASAKHGRGEISDAEFQEEIAKAVSGDVRHVSGSDGGNGGEAAS